MTLYKCKICGSDLQVPDGASVVRCENCGSQQTISTSSDDILVNLYNKANNLRQKCEFDRAAETYEKILDIDNTQAEAHWGVVLCKFGIEYVEPSTGDDDYERKPTCHRTQLESILSDPDFQETLRCADSGAKSVYEEEAQKINLLQKKILTIVKSEKPFDVFICYKDRDEQNQKTRDSVIANEIYHELTTQGLNVFFSAITLEDKLGVEYEPYIYAALSSAKVMIVIGTKLEYFNAIWVKNEWSRYLHMMKMDDGKKRTLIPCYKDIDPYDLPDEFSHLQSLDMSKIAFINDLIRSVKKLITPEQKKTDADDKITPSLKRAFLYLEDSEFKKADEYLERVLELDPENAKAYIGKLMVSKRVTKEAELANLPARLSGNSFYEKACRFADDSYRYVIEKYDVVIAEKLREAEYQHCIDLMNSGDYINAATAFGALGNYKDAVELSADCLESNFRRIYDSALHKIDTKEYLEAVDIFKSIENYRDAKKQIERCYTLNNQKIYDKAQSLIDNGSFLEAAEIFKTISDFKDANAQLNRCYTLNNQRIYDEALSLINTGSFLRAAEVFESIKDFKDAKNQIDRCYTLNNQRIYDEAVSYVKAGNFLKAAEVFKTVSDFKDARNQVNECYRLEKQRRYDNASSLFRDGYYTKAASIFEGLSDFKDAKERYKQAIYSAGKRAVSQNDLVGAMTLFNRIPDYLDAKKLYTDAQNELDRRERKSEHELDRKRKKANRKVALRRSRPTRLKAYKIIAIILIILAALFGLLMLLAYVVIPWFVKDVLPILPVVGLVGLGLLCLIIGAIRRR